MQNFGVTNKEYYGMLWYFLEWSIQRIRPAWPTKTKLRMTQNYARIAKEIPMMT